MDEVSLIQPALCWILVGEGLCIDLSRFLIFYKPSPCILDIEYAREVEDISQDGEGESEPSL